MGKMSILGLLVALFSLATPAFATHIVGGEFELKYNSNNRYLLSLILYNDDINGNPAAVDPYADVHIWSKGYNRLIGTYRLYLQDQTSIDYNVPNCPNLPIKTSKVVYASYIELSPAIFSDAEGYYVVYERCCRNNIIDNIQNPESTGQTFYMEFPAVGTFEDPFINSSPSLPPPPSEYLPVGQPFSFDMQAHDPDGDELVYRLVEPLAGYSSPEYPIPAMPMSRPYPTVNWKTDYSLNQMIRGEPSLTIKEDRFLELTPTQEGLFVFAVAVDEYRNGIKIGEVRREYQMVVYTPNNSAPDVTASLNAYEPAEELTFEFVLGESATYTVKVADEEDNRISLRAQGDGFTLNRVGMTFASVTGKGEAQGTFSWQPTCDLELIDGKAVFTVFFIGEDVDICNANEADTLVVHMVVSQSPNMAPAIEASLSGAPVISPLSLTFGDQDGQPLIIDLSGIDPDVSNGLNLRLDSVSGPTSFPYSWQDASGTGTVSSALILQDRCAILNGQSEALLIFYFSVKDDACNSKADTVTVTVEVKDIIQDFPRVKYANTFTPNGDQCNAWFELKDLPEDACYNRFEYIGIYNRWGKLLFESNDRFFKWYAENQPAGTYYYLLKYTDFTYRSPLTLLLGNSAGNKECTNP